MLLCYSDSCEVESEGAAAAVRPMRHDGSMHVHIFIQVWTHIYVSVQVEAQVGGGGSRSG